MILKSFCVRVQVSRKYLMAATNYTHNICRNYSHCSIVSKHRVHTQPFLATITCHKCQLQCYSRGILDVDPSDLQNAQKEREIENLATIFPSPRLTLNELASKCPDSVFDIQYKQASVAPKETRNKVAQNDWTCTYMFEWPQKIMFESTAKSKRQAAEKAAFQALHWLHTNKLIDSKGYPIFDKSVVKELRNLQEPIKASISENSMDRISGIWEDHENAIKIENLATIFPSPRLTLNELAAKCSDIVFDIQYKQASVAPKETKNKMAQNDWTCTYMFVWPQKITFESTAKSKRQAAEKAAFQALHWLHTNKLIDSKGYPIFDKSVVKELRNPLQEPIKASISENSMDMISVIWEDYENGIKDIYTATFEAAAHRVVAAPAVLAEDSTIDEQESKLEWHPVYGRPISPPTERELDRRKRQLAETFQVYNEERTQLPIDEYSKEITSAISESRVSMIVGAAGCGKSTRAPVAVLQSSQHATIIVSEPRRVAAVGLASRVASELGEQVGETVGYQVRLELELPQPPAGSILYCTSGVLLRRLQRNPGLKGCSHVFIDEAHERDVNTDLTLLLLRRALDLNPALRVVIMSATLDTDVFTRYFNSCPVVEVPGRTFPVETLYLDGIQQKYGLQLSNTFKSCEVIDGNPQVNCQEVVEVVKAVDRTESEGAILVFLPGWAEIKQTKLLLDQCFEESTHLVLPVHSMLSTTDQARMFSEPLPGVRKVVLATNIAETSITIPDVVYVVDSGVHKETSLREGTGTASLAAEWVSRANARQRAGRAGRIKSGHCLKLYTKEKEDEFIPFSTPQILRVPLEKTVLDCKTYAPEDKVEDFLSQLPEPPSSKAIQLAVNDLIDLGALSATEQLTRLGSLLSSFTLHPRLARALLASAVLDNVEAVANVMVHCNDKVEVFAAAADRKEEIREIKREFSAKSDHVALYRIQEEYSERVRATSKREVEAWCRRYGLIPERLAYVSSISNLYLDQLFSSPAVQPFPDAERLSRRKVSGVLAPAALLCGADALLVAEPRLRTRGKLRAEVALRDSKGDRAHICSSSVNHAAARTRGALFACFGAVHSRARRALVPHAASRVTPHAALLLCRHVRAGENYDDTTVLTLPRHKLDIHVPTSQADHILKAREMLSGTLQYYVERDPNAISYKDELAITRFKESLVETIRSLLVEAHQTEDLDQ